VPSLLRATDIMLHLENRFPVPIHAPSQPYEAISTETPLLMSREMHNKIKTSFPRTESHFTVVEDPEDIPELRERLAFALTHVPQMREAMRSIHNEFKPSNDWKSHVETYVDTFKSVMNPGPISNFVRLLRWTVRGGDRQAQDR
jgi:hypothetical protein